MSGADADRQDGSDDGEEAVASLLDQGHLVAPDDLVTLIANALTRLGAQDAELLVVDHAQRVLVPLSGAGEPLALEGTVAGRAFRQLELQDHAAPDGRQVWVPIVDGVERVGVLGASVPELDDRLRTQLTTFAAAVALLVLSKSLLGDALTRAARRRPMSLAAEMQWSLMPPLTAANERVVVSAMLEPAYEVGGDLIDYSLGTDRLQLAVFDSMGHGLDASVVSAVAVGSYRNARRSGATLAEQARRTEEGLQQQFGGERFVTAVLAELDLVAGRLRWIDAGHPAPLVLRGGRVVKALKEEPDRPLGMGLNQGFAVREESLEPGDRVVAYTDGVVEARSAEGEPFGVERLVDFIVRAAASDEPAPETMRRLSHALLAHQGGELSDDATQLMVEWRPRRPERLIP